MIDPMAPTALVTGAAHRIGREIALDLARSGWKVAVHYGTSETEASEVATEIRAAGGWAETVGADLADEAAVSRLVADAADALGPVGCLVNNAAVFEMDQVHDARRELWDRHMEINLRAPFVLSQRFADALPEGVEGNVINVLDERVWNLTPYFMSYTVSKSGLWTLTRTLALALAPRIRVNGIGPGPTLPSQHQGEEQFANQVARLPLKKATPLEDIGAAIRFILEARSMTGQMIALDGGQHLGWAFPEAIDPSEA